MSLFFSVCLSLASALVGILNSVALWSSCQMKKLTSLKSNSSVIWVSKWRRIIILLFQNTCTLNIITPTVHVHVIKVYSFCLPPSPSSSLSSQICSDQSEEEGNVFAPLKLSKMVLDHVSQFNECLPTLHILCKPGLRQYHWDQVIWYTCFLFVCMHVHIKN